MKMLIAAVKFFFEFEAGVKSMNTFHFGGGFAADIGFLTGDGIVVFVEGDGDVDSDASQ